MDESTTSIPETVSSMVRMDGNIVWPRYVTEQYLKDIYALELRNTDVLVITWPKSGTTWMQCIVLQIIHGKQCLSEKHFYYQQVSLELPINYKDENSEGCYKMAPDLPSPRLLKSHLMIRFLPRDIFKKKPKVIYVARNPKDVAVSFYNFSLMWKSFPTYSWSEVVDLFCKGLLVYGDWFEHVLEWWHRKDEPNVLFVKYEDMKQDLTKIIAQVGTFLGKSLAEDAINEICQNMSFENMRGNQNANQDTVLRQLKKEEGKHISFMRKGVVGDWKNWFTVAQNEKFDKIYKERMAGTGLDFSFE